LLYLASQIRQNSKLLEAAAEDSRIQTFNATTALVTGDPEISRIYWDGIEDRESLSEADRRRFDSFMSMTWQAFTQQWEHHRRGESTATSWDQALLGMRWQCGRSGVADWWKEYRGLYSPAFRDFVDGLFRESEAAE
jgi:hypothetical protein